MIIIQHLALFPYITNHPIYLLTQSKPTFLPDTINHMDLKDKRIDLMIQYPSEESYLKFFDEILLIW